MQSLLFDADQVLKQIEHARQSKAHRPTFAESEEGTTPGAGLFLVGDQGVYLMSNGNDADLPRDGVVYAQGINPDVDAFDDWWARKREACGGDDFVDRLPDEWIDVITTEVAKLRALDTTRPLQIEILVSEEQMGLGRIGQLA